MASEVKANKLSPSSGTDLTLGDASDTVIVPTGATLNIVDGLGVAGGGTGLASFTAGDILYATGTTTLAKLAKGSAEQVLAMNSGATAPDWGSVDLTVLPTITVAKGGTNLSSFTAGDILYATGSTTLAKLAKGTGLYGLRMNAGATAPEWAAAAGGGAWEYLARQTLGSDASDITFKQDVAATDGTPDFGSDYAAIMFVLEHFSPSASTSQHRLRMSTDGGSSFITSGYNAATQYIEGPANATTTISGTDNFRLGTETEDDTTYGLSGQVFFYNTSETAKKPYADWHFCCVNNGNTQFQHYRGGGVYDTNANVDAVQFFFHSGNVVAGATIRMYGLNAD